MALTTETTLDNLIPEVWSTILNSVRDKNLVWNPLFDHRFESEFSGQPLDTIHVNGIDNFAAISGTTIAEAYSAGLDPVLTRAGALTTQVDISVTRHYYKSFALTHDADLLSNVSTMTEFSGRAGYAVALEHDSYLAGFVDDWAQTVGTLNDDLDEDDVIRAVQYLNDANVPYENRYAVISNAEDANVKKWERFVNVDYAKTVGSFPVDRGRGFIGSAHGLDWHVSNNVEGSNSAGHDNAIFGQQAVAVVVKEKMRVEGPTFDLESDSMEYAVHSYYGAREMRDTDGVWVKGR